MKKFNEYINLFLEVSDENPYAPPPESSWGEPPRKLKEKIQILANRIAWLIIFTNIGLVGVPFAILGGILHGVSMPFSKSYEFFRRNDIKKILEEASAELSGNKYATEMINKFFLRPTKNNLRRVKEYFYGNKKIRSLLDEYYEYVPYSNSLSTMQDVLVPNPKKMAEWWNDDENFLSYAPWDLTRFSPNKYNVPEPNFSWDD